MVHLHDGRVKLYKANGISHLREGETAAMCVVSNPTEIQSIIVKMEIIQPVVQ